MSMFAMFLRGAAMGTAGWASSKAAEFTAHEIQAELRENTKTYFDPNNHRRKFDEALDNEAITKHADPCTLKTVKAMSGAMALEGVPMSQDHCTKAIASIQKGDNLRQFLATENTEVVKARQGVPRSFRKPVYSVGSLSHEYLFSQFKTGTGPEDHS